MKGLNSKEDKCPVCGESLFTKIKWLGQERYSAVACACERKKKDNEMDWLLVKEQRQSLLARYSRISIVDAKALTETFNKAVIDDENRELYQMIKYYCQHFDEAMKENTGLYIFGERGRGKSFIANAVYNWLKKDYTVLLINLNMYSNMLKKGYEVKKEREIELLEATRKADLLVIDDIGTEILSEWLTEKIFNLVNYREIVRKPLIITSNLNYADLEQKFKEYDEHTRIKSRIQGMCLDLELKGPDRRENPEKFNWLIDGVMK